jgi:hypothetical protein
MLALLWNLSAAIRGYLRFYMPTNRALDWLRTPHRLKWAVPAAVVLTPAYLYAMSVAAVIGARPGLGWLNVLVILFCWNGVKFAWLAALAPFTASGSPFATRGLEQVTTRCQGCCEGARG